MFINNGDASDAMGRVAALLTWAELEAVLRCCRATRDRETSVFYRAWVDRTALVLPPDSLACRAILSTVTDVNAVVIPHSKWLRTLPSDEQLAPRLARVRRVTLDRDRYHVKPRQFFHLSVIAHTFPSTTHLRIHRLHYVRDIGQLQAFRCLQRLELSSGENMLACPVSATKFISLEELKLTRVDIRSIQSKNALISLQSLQIHSIERIGDLVFLRHAHKLTELDLGHAIVSRTAVYDLLEIAPRLTRFRCSAVQSVWPRDAVTMSGVDGDRLALAFKKLESLTVHVHDLSSMSLISSLRELNFGYCNEVAMDLSPLQELVRLERLSFSSYNRVDLTPLATLPRLVALTYAFYRQDSEGHSDRTSLGRLQVFEGSYQALKCVQDLDSLCTLRVDAGPTTGPPVPLPLDTAPRLRTLQISQSFDLSDLHRQCPRIRDLTLSTSSAMDTASLPPLTHVLANVARLGDLESLCVRSRRDSPQGDVLEFERLPPLRKLRKLVLSSCRLATLRLIEKLPSLHELDVRIVSEMFSTNSTFALDLSPLASLSHLRVLKMSYTDTDSVSVVVDVAPLERLSNLQELTLTKCTIPDITPLTRISSLRMVELPRGYNCEPLVIAYHAARLRVAGAAMLELREVRHVSESFWGKEAKRESRNCLWGTHYHSKRIKFLLAAMVNQSTSLQQPGDTT